MNSLGERLRLIRKASNLKQSELAEEIGVSVSNISRVEKDEINPSATIAKQICKYFCISADWFLFGEGEMHRSPPHAQNPAASELTPAELALLENFAKLSDMERGAILERTKMTVELKGDKEKHTASTQPCPSTVAPPRPSAPQPIIKPKPVPPTTAAPKSAQPRPTAPSSSAAAQNIIRTAAPTPQPTNKPNTDTKPTATSQPTQKSSIPAAAPASPPDNYTEPPPTIEMKVYLESAAAGFGNYLSESTFDLIPFPENEVPPRADFGVRISGDSMEPTIPNNSIAWIEATPQIENGQIGIFVLNNEAFCKELSIDQENKTAYLISHNGKYKTIEIKLQDNCRTIGRVLFQG